MAALGTREARRSTRPSPADRFDAMLVECLEWEQADATKRSSGSSGSGSGSGGGHSARKEAKGVSSRRKDGGPKEGGDSSSSDSSSSRSTTTRSNSGSSDSSRGGGGGQSVPWGGVWGLDAAIEQNDQLPVAPGSANAGGSGGGSGGGDDDDPRHGGRALAGGDARLQEVMAGALAGVRSRAVVDALRVCYLKYSPLRLGGDLIFILLKRVREAGL